MTSHNIKELWRGVEVVIDFPQGYFEDEVRDGFYVNGLMKKCWAAQIEVLSDIATICTKYNIKWYADCGTLLGAVRHGGFIPWDDDLDICMFREDYIRFLSVAENELKSIYSNYRIHNFHNEDFWEMISRVDNATSIEYSKEHLAKFHGYPFRAGVDIFPLDYMCENRAEEEERMRDFRKSGTDGGITLHDDGINRGTCHTAHESGRFAGKISDRKTGLRS